MMGLKFGQAEKSILYLTRNAISKTNFYVNTTSLATSEFIINSQVLIYKHTAIRGVQITLD